MSTQGLINKLEVMQEERIKRLEDMAFYSGRVRATIDNPLITENVDRARDENNKADADYSVYNLPF